jgi:hypothetical protein
MLGIVLSLAWSAHLARSQEEETAPATKSSRPSKTEDALERKLDEVLANQKAILQKFDAVMEELRVIKIRATQGARRP